MAPPFTLQNLKDACAVLNAMFEEQKRLKKAFVASRSASYAVEETINKVGQRLRKMEGELKITIHRFEMLKKTSSDDTSNGTNPAPYKNFFVELESSINREHKEMGRLSGVVHSGDTAADDEKEQEHAQNMAKLRVQQRGGDVEVESRETRLSTGDQTSYEEQVQDGTLPYGR